MSARYLLATLLLLALSTTVLARLGEQSENDTIPWYDLKDLTRMGAAKHAAEVAAAAAHAPSPEVESCSFMKSLVTSTFSGDEDIWLCIGFRESSYIPTARNPFSGATGLFQVEPIHCGNMPGCPAAGSGCVSGLEDPYTNAACARSVYNAQGFGAWTTYPECASGGGPCQ